jgi:large subunit ribosomal protein L17
MRHRKAENKLGRTTSHRKAMLRNMVTSFLKYEKIKTTNVKAKELKKVAEKMITLGKKGSLHARRQALSFIRDKEMVGKLFNELSLRYLKRTGGYTRIIKIGYRIGDNAPMSLVEFVQEMEKKDKTKKKLLTRRKKEVA